MKWFGDRVSKGPTLTSQRGTVDTPVFCLSFHNLSESGTDEVKGSSSSAAGISTLKVGLI